MIYLNKVRINLPITDKEIKELCSGDQVLLTGNIYTARDAAHKRMIEEFEQSGKLPFDIKGQIIYYVGPCPNKPGDIIGSAGPTTSGRMDLYTPKLLSLGLKGMIGKGERSEKVVNSIVENNVLYFGAIGGAGALLREKIKQVEIIAYPDLGTEAIRKLYVEEFPVIVIIDSKGKNLYKSEPIKYRR